MIKNLTVLFLTVLCVLALSSCSEVREFITDVEPEEETINEIMDPAEAGNIDRELDKYQEYYDEKTGQRVSKTQYMLYQTEDRLKVQGFVVAVVFWIAGFLIRFVVKKSTKIRRIAFFFEMMPLFYIVIVYLLAFIADAM